MNRALDHIYIFGMIVLTAYSQMIMRWQVGLAGALPVDTAGKIGFAIKLFANPWILSSIVATFLAGVSWMFALSRFQLSYAYPFTGLLYLLVMLAGITFFRDNVSIGRIVGTSVVMLGVLIIARAG